MGRADYKTCKQCHRHADEVGTLSHTRLCMDCSTANRRAAALDLLNHHGPYFQRWRHGVAASVGATFLDDAPTKP